MKKVVIILTTLIVIISVVFYVSKSKGDPSQLDNIEMSQIGVRTGSSSPVYLGYSTQQVSDRLGIPQTETTEYWEMHEKNALIYVYNGARLEFIDNKLESYELSGSDYLVGGNSNGNFFNVNSSLNSVSAYLPNWYSQKGDNALSANITKNGQQTDTFIYIEFNPSTEVITKISTRSY